MRREPVQVTLRRPSSALARVSESALPIDIAAALLIYCCPAMIGALMLGVAPV